MEEIIKKLVNMSELSGIKSEKIIIAGFACCVTYTLVIELMERGYLMDLRYGNFSLSLKPTNAA